jgi:hypothetical protein
MMRRDREVSCELRQRALRVRGERLARSGDERVTRMRGSGTPRRDGTRIVLLERASGKCDCTLDELVRIDAPTCSREQQPVLEIDLGWSSKRSPWKRRLAALE